MFIGIIPYIKVIGQKFFQTKLDDIKEKESFGQLKQLEIQKEKKMNIIHAKKLDNYKIG